MLNNNPAQYVDLPKKQKTEMKAMNQEQVEAFLSVAKLNRHYTLFALMLGTGLRPGEALGLKKDDFDAMKSTLYIQRSFDPKHGFKAPKTKRSKRLIKLPEHLVKLLLEHQESIPFKTDLIFPNQNNKPHNDRHVVQRHYQPCLEKAGLGHHEEIELNT